MLNARLALLRRRYDQAIRQYRRAQVLSAVPDTIETELAAAYALRAEFQGRPSDVANALEHAARSLLASRFASVARYNAALVFEQAGLLRDAGAEWQDAAATETDVSWRAEAEHARAALEKRIAAREEMIARLKDPESLESSELDIPGALEIAQQQAIEDWISRRAPPREALHLLAESFAVKYGDLWWRDFLSSRHSAEGLRLLSRAQSSYEAGQYQAAGDVAAEAEREFARIGNTAGRLYARRQRIEASHRGDHPQTCPNLLKGFDAQVNARRYRWLQAEAWLDEITCRSLLRQGASLDDRAVALQRIEAIGFEGASLRALAFLTEPQVTADSPMRVFSRGFEGLKRFWGGAVPDYRLHHFCWSLAEAAGVAAEPRAAVLLMRESALNLRNERDPGLSAMVVGDLAAAEAAAGLHAQAASHLRELDRTTSLGDPHAPSKYVYEIERDHAKAELAEGKLTPAISRLYSLQNVGRAAYSNAPLKPPNDLDRADILNTLGTALLRQGRLQEASLQFRALIDMNKRILSSSSSQLERDSLTNLYGSAFRGLTEVRLRMGDSPATVLADWLAFRNGTAGKAPPRLPAQTVVLAFAVLPDGVSAWMTDGNYVDQNWIKANQVPQAANRLTALAADSDAPIATIQDAARTAGNLLLSAFAARLDDLARSGRQITLLIDADGVLAKIPWGLIETAKGEALIQRFSLVQTAGHWKHGNPAPVISRVSRVAVLADPDVGDLRNEFPPLLDAREEGQLLVRRFQSVRLVEGKSADWTSLSELASQTQVLHFAGHSESTDGFGALVLAGSPAFVTADQISRLDLSRLGLAVLASCSSGPAGESGQVNADTLVRAFLDAGAARVLASNWDVDSLATKDLMERFYSEVVGGRSVAAALRAAMLELRSHPGTAHPSAWAGFQLYGAPN